MVSTQKSSHQYRPDLDGLRALAILVGLVFHTYPQAMPGGFIGVDVFFVISGYLISGHILEALQAGKFSFFEFYARRCCRILPSLALVLFSIWFIARWTFLPAEFAMLGKHLLSASAFVSNIIFYGESGYFAITSNLKPFLNLWSLAIEEQFYLFWPVLLFFFRGKKKTTYLISILFISSFIFSCFEVKNAQTAAFFLLPSRFWELLVGAALVHIRSSYFVSNDRFSNLKSTIALLLLCLGVAFFDWNSSFPGPLALIPTISALLLIDAGASSWVNRRILSNPVLVFIGTISYPIYLWNWPLLGVFRINFDGSPSLGVRMGIAVLTIVLALLTHYGVEVPARKLILPKKKDIHPRAVRVVFVSIGALAIGGSIGLLTWRGGLQTDAQLELSNSPLTKYQVDNLKENQIWKDGCFATANDRSDKFQRNHCFVQNFPGRPKVYLLGDSFAAYLSRGLEPYLKEQKVNFAQFTANFCTPLEVHDKRGRCAEINRYIFAQLKADKPDILIIYANYQQYPKFYESDIKDYPQFLGDRTREFKSLGIKHVIVLGQYPSWKMSLPAVLGRHFVLKHRSIPERTFEGVVSECFAVDLKLKEQRLSDNSMFISLRDGLCDENGCLTKVGPDLGKDLMVFDYGHLTDSGAAYVTRKIIAPKIQSFIQ